MRKWQGQMKLAPIVTLSALSVTSSVGMWNVPGGEGTRAPAGSTSTKYNWVYYCIEGLDSKKSLSRIL